jgi:hypothetical protein
VTLERTAAELRRNLWFSFVALLVCPGGLPHLIVLRFVDAFFEHLRTFAPSLVIFVFSARCWAGYDLTAIRRAFLIRPSTGSRRWIALFSAPKQRSDDT